MAKMFDLGYKYNDKPECCPGTKEDKSIHYPSMYLSDKVPKEIMDMEVGDVITITAKVKVSSKSIDSNNGGTKTRAELQFMKMAVTEISKKESEELEGELKRQLK